MQVYYDTKLTQGTKVKDEDSGKIYEVLSCIDLAWLSQGEKTGYMLTLKEVLQWA